MYYATNIYNVKNVIPILWGRGVPLGTDSSGAVDATTDTTGDTDVIDVAAQTDTSVRSGLNL